MLEGMAFKAASSISIIQSDSTAMFHVEHRPQSTGIVRFLGGRARGEG